MCFKKWIEDEGETMKVDENKTYSTKRRMCLVSFCFYSWSQSFYMSSVYEFTVWFHIHIIDSNFLFQNYSIYCACVFSISISDIRC